MKKQLIKMTTTAILASSMVGCGIGKTESQPDNSTVKSAPIEENQKGTTAALSDGVPSQGVAKSNNNESDKRKDSRTWQCFCCNS